MDVVSWILLTVGAAVLLVAVLLRAAQRNADAEPGDPTARETGLIQALPASAAPASAPPAMFGLLAERELGARDLAITLLDLAARGHLRIRPLTEPGQTSVYDWTLHRTPQPSDDLRRYETTLLVGLFDQADGVTTRALTGLASSRSTLDKALDELRGALKEVGWLAAPRRRTTWGVIGGIVLLLGLLALISSLFGLVALTVSWQSLVGGACLVVAGVLLVGRARLRPTWTTAGDAAQRQLARYRTWLGDVEAHEIRLEDASSVLNRHLASAFAFGAERHLGDVLDQLVRRATSWSQSVPIAADWLDDDHPAWTDAPLPGQIVTLADQFIGDAVRIFERAGVGLGKH